jgi:hypothetical protein
MMLRRLLKLRTAIPGSGRVPPARPRLEQRYVERIAYRELMAGRIDQDEYLAALRRARGAA